MKTRALCEIEYYGTVISIKTRGMVLRRISIYSQWYVNPCIFTLIFLYIRVYLSSLQRIGTAGVDSFHWYYCTFSVRAVSPARTPRKIFTPFERANHFSRLNSTFIFRTAKLVLFPVQRKPRDMYCRRSALTLRTFDCSLKRFYRTNDNV